MSHSPSDDKSIAKSTPIICAKQTVDPRGVLGKLNPG